MLTFQTQLFLDYMSSFSHVLLSLESAFDDPFEDLQFAIDYTTGAQALLESKILVGRSEVINEIRANLIGLNSHQKQGYRNYLLKFISDREYNCQRVCKSFDDSIRSKHLLEQEYEDVSPVQFESLDEVYKTVGDLLLICKEEIEITKFIIEDEFINDVPVNYDSLPISNIDTNFSDKINWLGTPAQLSFILNLLRNKGYITLKGKGEAAAKQVLQHFDIEGSKNSVATLARCFQELNRDELPISPEDAAKFVKFPARSDLNK